MRIPIASLLAIFVNMLSYGQIVVKTAQDAVDIGLLNTDEYRIEKLQALNGIKQARYAISDFLPRFNVSWTESDAMNISSLDSRNKSLQFGVTQTVFNGGKTKLAYDMSRISAFFSYTVYEQDVKKFSAQIIQSYFNYITQLKYVKVKQDLIDNALEQLTISRAEFEHGLILASDYLECEIAVLQMQNEIKQLEREVRTSLRAFKILIGLPLESELLIEPDDELNADSDFFLEPYSNLLLNLVLNTNSDLKQQRLSLEYSKKQLVYNNRFYLPAITLEGSVSFSGEYYPLTEPSYSVKLGFSFADNPFLPFSWSESYGYDNNGFKSIGNTVNATLQPDITYSLTRKRENLTLQKTQLDYKMKIQAMKEDVLTKIAAHDDCIDSLEIICKTLKLQEQRLTVCNAEVLKGEKKRIEYLDALGEYAEMKIQFAKLQSDLISSWYNLELLTNVPLGELRDVCLSSSH